MVLLGIGWLVVRIGLMLLVDKLLLVGGSIVKSLPSVLLIRFEWSQPRVSDQRFAQCFDHSIGQNTAGKIQDGQRINGIRQQDHMDKRL